MTPAAIDNPGYVTSNYSGPFTWEGDYDTKILNSKAAALFLALT